MARPHLLMDGDAAIELLRLYLLMHGRLLLGLLLRVLFGKVPADEATANGSNHGVMSGVMTGDTADDRALDATGRDLLSCVNNSCVDGRGGVSARLTPGAR
jgi:hypothetical protein